MKFFGFIFLATVIVVGLQNSQVQQILTSLHSLLPASVFFTDSITESDLLSHYKTAKKGGQPVRIIIVPGHDNELPGTTYRGLREADMAVQLGDTLAKLLSTDPEFTTIMTRTNTGYNSMFWDYRQKEKQAILDFVTEKKQTMADLVRTGAVHEHEGVKHNKAPGEVVTTLYAINKWANENNADVVIHIHFNDMAGRGYEVPGDYTGFALYVPEKQYSNARASRVVAETIARRLSRFYIKSDLPKEDAGVVESQDLIAVGAYNTLDSVGMLIEYSYIYEPQFDTKVVRDKTIDELAWQTYLGLHDFFKTDKSKSLAITHPLIDIKNSVFDVQKAFLLAGVYPPAGKTLRQCPLSGNFGECTKTALGFFQAREVITNEKGKLGPQTLGSLREQLASFGL